MDSVQVVKRFVIIGGHVGDHRGRPTFVAASELVRLYGLDPFECVIVNSPAHLRARDLKDRIILRPVANGDYSAALAAAIKKGANE